MSLPSFPTRTAIWSAFATALSLTGGVLLGVLVGSATFNTLPGHMSEISKSSLAAIPALAGMFAGGALWGYLMGRLTGRGDTRRMVWAGGIGFGMAVILVGIGLTRLEVAIVQNGMGPRLPVHQVFTMLFVPAAFVIAGFSGLSLGVALKDGGLAGQLALRGGLAAALGFLVVNLAMDALGWRVGGPDAARRFTMLTVMFVSNFGAALAGGAVIGSRLSRRSK